jgi:Domain of unknown function (DUF4296)
MKNISIIIILSTLLLFSCNSNKQKEIIALNEMKLIVWDMLQAGEWGNISAGKDSLFHKNGKDFQLFYQVLELHHINKEQFYNSYKFYQEHPDKMKVLMDSISDFGNREKNAAFKIHQ